MSHSNLSDRLRRVGLLLLCVGAILRAKSLMFWNDYQERRTDVLRAANAPESGTVLALVLIADVLWLALGEASCPGPSPREPKE